MNDDIFCLSCLGKWYAVRRNEHSLSQLQEYPVEQGEGLFRHLISMEDNDCPVCGVVGPFRRDGSGTTDVAMQVPLV